MAPAGCCLTLNKYNFMLNKYNFVRMFKSEADIPKDRLKYAEGMFAEIYLNKKNTKKTNSNQHAILVSREQAKHIITKLSPKS